MRTRAFDNTSTAGGIRLNQAYIPSVANGAFGPRYVEPVLPSTSSSEIVNELSESFGDSSVITDEIVPIHDNMRGIGEVSHVKRRVQEAALNDRATSQVEFVRTSYASNLGRYHCMRRSIDKNGWYSARSWASGWGYVDVSGASSSSMVPNGRTDDRAPELVPKLMSRIKGLQLANAAWEAREFPTLLKMFKQRQALDRSLKHIYEWYSRRGPDGFVWNQRKILDLVKAFREGSLNWFFGLSPTIGDLKSVLNEVKKPKTFRRLNVVAVRDTSGGSSFKERFVYGLGTQRFVTRRQRSRVFGARLLFYKEPGNEYLTDLFNKTQNILDRYIGTNPLGMVWEAIPFSFVVDWFLSVDNVLDNIFLHNNGRFSISYWKSTKDEILSDLSWQFASEYESGVGTSSSAVPVYQYADSPTKVDSLTYYHRTRMEPPSPISQLKARAGTKQLYLLALIALGLRGPISGKTAK